MKLDDVLAMAGDHQLSSFDWGASAVVLVNSLMAKENRIDVDHTGKEAYDKLRRLPSATLIQVLTREVEVAGGCVEFLGTPIEQARGLSPTVPTSQRKMSPIAIFLMIIMVVIGMGLTFTSMQVAKETGQMPDTETLQTVLQTMAELVKDEQNRVSPAPAP